MLITDQPFIFRRFLICTFDKYSPVSKKDHTSGQARSWKFAMGGYFGGVEAEPSAAGSLWGSGEKPPEARGLGAKLSVAGDTRVWGRSPQCSKISHFLVK